MRALITGGVGFIGSHLAEDLLSLGHEVLVLDNYATARRDTLAEPRAGLRVLEADIAHASVVDCTFDLFRPELVLHCAASYKDPENWRADVMTNVLGTVNVVKAALRLRAGRLIYFQTAL